MFLFLEHLFIAPRASLASPSGLFYRTLSAAIRAVSPFRLLVPRSRSGIVPFPLLFSERPFTALRMARSPVLLVFYRTLCSAYRTVFPAPSIFFNGSILIIFCIQL